MNVLSGCYMDRYDKSVAEDFQDGEKMDTAAQPGAWTAGGGIRTTAGGQGKLATSTAVDVGRDQYIIRVGTIGCSAFGINRFGSA